MKRLSGPNLAVQWVILSVRALVLAAAVFYIFPRAESGTQLGLTLTSQPVLEDGLLLHWTFDGPDWDQSEAGAEVRDRSGNGRNGNAFFPPNASAGGSDKLAFTTDDTWDVPAGVTTVTIKTWGGGGGGGGGEDSNDGGSGGGGGGFARGDVSVSPSGTLTIHVGGGGNPGDSLANNNSTGGGGGGFSGVSDDGGSTYLIQSGGGGGGGGSRNDGQTGGGGGGGSGSNGADGGVGAGQTCGTGNGDGGSGGTTSSGGAGGSGCSDRPDGTAGSANQGGAGGNTSSGTGSGAAGGAHGGGAGGGETGSHSAGAGGEGGNTAGSGGGGGGAGKTDGLANVTTGTGSTGTTGADGGGDAANTADGDYAGSAGLGGDGGIGGIGSAGNPGRVVLFWQLPAITPGAIGQALGFDGIDDHVAGGDIDGGNAPRAVAFWMKAATTTASHSLVHLDYSNADYITTDSSGNITANGFTADAIYVDGSSASANIPDTDWHHVVVVLPSGLAADDFSIASTTSSVKPFGGDMDDVRVYNKVLTAEEAERLYKLGATTKFNTSVNTQPTLETGLVGHWTFDGPDIDLGQVTAEVRDRSGQGNHGDWQNHASTTRPGAIGQALEFDGVDDLVHTVNLSVVDTDLTLAAWVKPTALNNELNSIIAKWDAAASRKSFTFTLGSDGSVDFSVRTPSGTEPAKRTAADLVSRDTWHHLAVVYAVSAQGATIYINGSAVPNSQADDVQDEIQSASTVVRLGNDAETTNAQFTGTLDDVRIYNRALSADDITRLHALGGTAKLNTTVNSQPTLETGLVGHWTFDGPDIDLSQNTAEVRDRSGQGNHGDWRNHASTTRPGKIGQALEFDGNAYITAIPKASIPTGDFTYATWVQMDSTDNVGIFGSYDSGAAAVEFALYVAETNNIRVVVNGGSPDIENVGPADIGVWYHYAVTRSGSDITLYVDSEVVATASDGAVLSFPTCDLMVGDAALSDCTGFGLDGRLDDARVYNRALSADEITALYRLGR